MEHRCAGGLKKLDLRSGSHAIYILYGFLTCFHEATLFTVIPRNHPFQSPLTTSMGIRRTYSRLAPHSPQGNWGGERSKVITQKRHLKPRSTKITDQLRTVSWSNDATKVVYWVHLHENEAEEE